MRVELDNGRLACTILPLGATLQSLRVPDREGRLRDVVLGYDTQAEYEQNDGYLGATVGRFANRIGGACFSLNGEVYHLRANEGENQLHGGEPGFSHRVWTVEEAANDRAVFSLFSPHGDEGYPGNLRLRVTYALEGTALRIRYEAVSEADTVCSLTNHSYFNLAGHGSVAEQELMICAEHYTPVDAALIPTGEIRAVEGTALDFRRMRPIGGGYDHNFALNAGTDAAAVLYSEKTGIEMTTTTTLPGVQVYSANFLTEREGKGSLERLTAGEGGDMAGLTGITVEHLKVKAGSAAMLFHFLSALQRVAVACHAAETKVGKANDTVKVRGKHISFEGKPLRVVAAGDSCQLADLCILLIQF